MTERRRPRVFDSAIRHLFGREGTVSDARMVAPGILALTIRADPPAGGWQPGHEIELWVGEGIVRHYTVFRVEAADRVTIVADLYAGGPGSRWLAEAGRGTPVEVAVGQHKDRPLAPGRAVLLGDASAVGLLGAIREHRAPDALLVIEAPVGAVDDLREWAPEVVFIPETDERGESLHRHLEALLRDPGAAEAYFLAGHAQTLQRMRATLLEGGHAHRRAIGLRAHWATGKVGL